MLGHRTQKWWDVWWLEMARHVATASRDPSTKVGAVIADRDNRLVSTGYNGFPRGVEDRQERLANRDMRLRMTVHSEKNAILFARRDLRGCTLYTTFIPCASCAGMIIQAGINRVVSPPPSGDLARRWADDIATTNLMFSEAGVILHFIQEEQS